jgi:asparagine synthetase A
MLEMALVEIRPLVFSLQMWDKEGKAVRGLASLKNKEEFEKLINSTFELSEPFALNFLVVEASFLAHKLPGVDKKVTHPVNKTEHRLFDIIISLNDDHKWTREQIADWIETLDEVPTF